MNLVDSSAWLEYFGGGRNAEEFAPAIENSEELLVPTLVLFEVFKRATQLQGEEVALGLMSVLLNGHVVELSASLALEAARLALHTGLSTADAIILATAHAENAVLWTQDAHFRDYEGVEFRAKR